MLNYLINHWEFYPNYHICWIGTACWVIRVCKKVEYQAGANNDQKGSGQVVDGS